MSPGIYEPDFGKMFDLLKGEISIGPLNLHYDLTDGLTREQFIEKEELKRKVIFPTKSGRLIIPLLGIY